MFEAVGLVTSPKFNKPEGRFARRRFTIGCPTSGVAQRAMREAAPHVSGVSKARQNNSKKVGYSQNPINCSEPFPCPLSPFSGKMTLSLDI
jgi:hypothetical protein